MSGRVYTVPIDAVAVSALQDLWMLAPAANKPIELLEVRIGQSSDAGDAEDELLRIRIRRGQTTVGSGGSSVTPEPAMPADTAAGVTARINDTTQAGTGTIAVLLADTFNVRAGYIWTPTPECVLWCTAAQTRITVELPAAPADAITLSGTLTFREYG